MLILNAHTFMQLLDLLSRHEQVLSTLSGPISLEQYELGKKSAENIAKQCADLELLTSEKVAKQSSIVSTYEEQRFESKHLRKTIFEEMRGRTFYGPMAIYASYFENPKLFGDAVFNAFPSATDDITEAGTCLAFERSTACVMHLMRALEVTLRALANAVGVAPQNDWGGYIREIGKELDKRAKTSGARSADEQFYAEAAIGFDNLKRAWRNPTMHVDKSYSQQRAAEILNSVKSFMSHLATKISE